MAALPYIQLYVADYLADTMHLTTEQHGAYLLIIMNYWQAGKPPHKDHLNAISRLNDRWSSVESSLKSFFEIDEKGYWFHWRIEADLEKVRAKQKQASDAGKKSAKIRALKNKQKQHLATDVAPAVDDSFQRNGNHTDTDTDTEKQITALDNNADSVIFYLSKKKRKLFSEKLEWFEYFWTAFDLKKGKAEAADSWIDIAGMNRELATVIYKAAQREAVARKKLTNGSTPKWAQGWLSGKRWEDEHTTTTNNSGTSSAAKTKKELNAKLS